MSTITVKNAEKLLAAIQKIFCKEKSLLSKL